ncbi:MAG: hypothetical protein Q4D34_05990 [Eggerthellaceae bacterium]|nr:hypothetical protein [Eggerthellaceae bacterium]
MRRVLFTILLVVACACFGMLLDRSGVLFAYAADEAAEVKPIEERPYANPNGSSIENGEGGTIESGNALSGKTQDVTKGGAEESQAAALLESEANRVNTQQLPDSSFIYDISIVDLAAADSYYDDQIVQVLGEVVGDRIFETADLTHCWITLDAPTTELDEVIAVYMTAESAQMIDTYGKYKTRGTMLQVRGVYHLACSEHQGISDIHADYVSVVQPGVTMDDTLEFASFLPGIIVLACAGALVLVYRRLREKER